MNLTNNHFDCLNCAKRFFINNSITDFLPDNIGPKNKEITDYFDKTSSIYETVDYYAELYSFYGGLWVHPEELIVPFINNLLKNSINDMLHTKGVVLDIGCGTGMFTRSIARGTKNVYGIDISWGMLQMAQEHVKNYNLNNITLARAKVENLPFSDDYFDGVSCCGALQLFSDLNRALVEINRILKFRGKLAVITYLKKEKSWGGMKPEQESLEGERQIHFFDVDELKNYIERTGYKNFEYHIYGSMILFRAEKI